MALILSTQGEQEWRSRRLRRSPPIHTNCAYSRKPIFNNFFNIIFLIYPLGSAWMCSISLGNWNWKSTLMVNPKVIIHQMLSEGFKITSWLDLFPLLSMGLCWKRKYLQAPRSLNSSNLSSVFFLPKGRRTIEKWSFLNCFPL